MTFSIFYLQNTLISSIFSPVCVHNDHSRSSATPWNSGQGGVTRTDQNSLATFEGTSFLEISRAYLCAGDWFSGYICSKYVNFLHRRLIFRAHLFEIYQFCASDIDFLGKFTQNMSKSCTGDWFSICISSNFISFMHRRLISTHRT
jgi:hypothetical protein